MISKQRGIIDPWTLGFLIGLTGLTITQPWDRESNVASKSTLAKVEQKSSSIIKRQYTLPLNKY